MTPTNPLQLLFLGTGTSAGVPMIGCTCDVCRSSDPRDNRSRASVLVSYGDERLHGRPRQLLVDTSPELRLQMIRHSVLAIDGVFYTHAHADHIFGLDDLRRFNAVMQAPIDLYTEPDTLGIIRQTFWYIFDPARNVNQSFVATLIPHAVEPGQRVGVHGATWIPLRLMHGRLPILGYRVEHGGHAIAYCTDVSSIPPATYPLLEGLDVLVIDALRYRHHPTHLSVDQALGVIEQVRPKRAYFTHIAHDIRHAELEAKLPEHVYLAFDGLAVSCGE